MRLKTFIILTTVTAVVAVAAVVEQSRTVRPTQVAAGDKLFADLGGELDRVARIEITTPDKTFAVAREGDQWTVRERGGYRADPNVVKRVLSALVEMETVEAKTDKPAAYSRIQVEDVTAKDAKSVQLVLKDGAGKDLARLIVGKTRYSRTGSGANRVYVRRPGEAQSWLVKASLDVERDPVRWLDRKIVDIPRDRVARVATSQPDGSRLALVKDQQGDDGTFQIQGTIPEGMKPKSPGDLGAPAGALSSLEFEDVKPVADIDFGKKPVGEAEYKTFDGLVVSIRMSETDDGSVWAIVDTSVDVAARPAEAPAKTETKPEDAKPAEGAAKDGDAATADKKAEAPAKPALKPLEDVRKEANEIARRTQGWAYKLPSFALGQFRAKMADMVEKEKSS